MSSILRLHRVRREQSHNTETRSEHAGINHNIDELLVGIFTQIFMRQAGEGRRERRSSKVGLFKSHLFHERIEIFLLNPLTLPHNKIDSVHFLPHYLTIINNFSLAVLLAPSSGVVGWPSPAVTSMLSEHRTCDTTMCFRIIIPGT